MKQELILGADLDVRHTSEFQSLAKTFKSDISINGVDSKQFVKLLSLELKKDDTILLEVLGEDEKLTMAEMSEILKTFWTMKISKEEQRKF